MEIDKYKQAEQLIDSLLNYSTNRRLMKVEIARMLQYAKENHDTLMSVVLNVNEDYTKERISSIVITIIDVVCQVCNVTKQELLSKSRIRHITDARSVATSLVFLSCNISLQHTGRIFNQDHATIMHSNRKYSQLIDVDATYRANVITILTRLKENGVVVPKANYETGKVELKTRKKNGTKTERT
jgi:chromosomal replication initiation ATPase DnaA